MPAFLIFVNYHGAEPICMLHEYQIGIFDDAARKIREVDEFLRFVHTGKADNEFTQKLLNEVSIAKLNEEWRDEYMTLLMRDKQNKAEGVLLLQEL